MSAARLLARNAACNWTGFAVQLVVAFLLTPFVLHSLGDARYGIWSLIVGLTGYYGLLDLGFRAGVTQYITRHLARKEFDQMNRAASTAFVALASCGLIILLASFVLAWLAPLVFDVPSEAVCEMRWCILIIAASMTVEFASFPFSAVFTATQRYDVSSSIGIATRILSATATFSALYLGYGLVGLCVVHSLGNTIDYAIRWRVAYRLLPQLSISWRRVSRGGLWEMGNYGIWSVVSRSADRLIRYSDVLVIGLFMPIAAIAPYALAVGLVGYFSTMFRPLVIVCFPRATQLDAQGDTAGLQRMYLAGSKLLLLLAVVSGLIAVTWADDFFRLWVGTRLVDEGIYPSPAVIFYILAAAVLAGIGARIGNQVLLGARRIKTVALLCLCEGVANLVLSICLVHWLGLVGVALGTLLPALLMKLTLYPIVICRFLKIPVLTFVRNTYCRPILAGAALAAMLWVVRGCAPQATGWDQLLAHGLISCALALPSAMLIGLERQELQRFVFAPVGRVLRRLGLRTVQQAPRIESIRVHKSKVE